jgi:hypothetical protein
MDMKYDGLLLFMDALLTAAIFYQINFHINYKEVSKIAILKRFCIFAGLNRKVNLFNNTSEHNRNGICIQGHRKEMAGAMEKNQCIQGQ